MTTSSEHQIQKALEIAEVWGNVDSASKKMWVIDQMVRTLTGCPVIRKKEQRETGPHEYMARGTSERYQDFIERVSWSIGWDEGVAP
jgi:hypothetical protein